MKLRIRTPSVVERKTSEILSKEMTKELNGDCRVRLSNVEFGMKDKKVYAHVEFEGEMDRSAFMDLIKMLKEGS